MLLKRRAIYKWRVRGRTLRKARDGRSMFYEVNANLRAATCRIDVRGNRFPKIVTFLRCLWQRRPWFFSSTRYTSATTKLRFEGFQP